jgi:hypothetical protein
MSILNQVLGATATTITTVPSGKTYAGVAIVFCNVTSSPVTITAYAYPTGGSAGTGTMIINSRVVPANDSYVFDSKLLLDAASVVSALCSTASAVTATISFMSI